MKNHILNVEIHNVSLAPAAAEVRVVARVDAVTATTELRGRLVGPLCAFASTVEVAYALRPLPAPERPAANELAARVVIPEGSLWDTRSPFLYGGPVELWEGDRRCDVVRVRHGLRDVRFGPRGWTLNGQPLAVRAKRLPAACSDAAALQLRQDGYNALVAPVRAETVSLWDVGDRLGFLVIGRVESADAETRDRIEALRRHPSSLGWLGGHAADGLDGLLTPAAVDGLGTID